MVGLDQVSDPVGDYAGFSASCSGQKQKRTLHVGNGSPLLRVQSFQKVHLNLSLTDCNTLDGGRERHCCDTLIIGYCDRTISTGTSISMHVTSPTLKYHPETRADLLKRRRVIRTLIRALERYERTCAPTAASLPRKPATPILSVLGQRRAS